MEGVCMKDRVWLSPEEFRRKQAARRARRVEAALWREALRRANQRTSYTGEARWRREEKLRP